MGVQDARLFCVGASFRTCPADIRDRLYVDEAERHALLAAVREVGMDQAILVSTCDRIEVQGIALDMGRAHADIAALLGRRAGITGDRQGELLYAYSDDDALRHVLRVAAALDSRIVGESQISGQVRQALQLSTELGMVGSELEQIYKVVSSTAKRIRNETGIGEGAVTVASAAIQVARSLFGDPADTRLMLCGLGDAGVVLAEQFILAGVQDVTLTGRARRTEREAQRKGWHFMPVDGLAEAMAGADIMVTAQGSGRYAVTRQAVEGALKKRRRKPVLLIDFGVPADIDPMVDDLEDAFRYTLDDIEKLAAKGVSGREKEAARAEAIVDEAVADFRRSVAALDGIPLLVALREHFEDIRRHVLDEHAQADAREATRLLLTHLLHRPSESLRRIASEGGAADLKDMITVNRVLTDLFGLEADRVGQQSGKDASKAGLYGDDEGAEGNGLD